MKVSIFKNIKETTNPFNRDVYFALNRIKNGNSKKLVSEIRLMESKEDRDKVKLTLPTVCFNGTFKTRSAVNLIELSGLIICDFDGFGSFEDAVSFRDSISSDKYIFAAWISPSGLGVKVLVKIPKDDNHKGRFESIGLYFNHPNWDKNNQGVSRGCQESYDPDIYINENSDLYIDCEEPDIEEIGSYEVYLPIKSDNRIISNLLEWWKSKYGKDKGSRNSNLFILAAAFNKFGVNKSECENVLYSYQEKDFRLEEIKSIIKSAYSKRNEFGTKFFEDKVTIEKIVKQVRIGKQAKDFTEDFPEHSKEEIEKLVDNTKKDLSVVDFWYYNDKGKVQLSPNQYKFWLQQNNFFKYFPTNSNTYTFIRKEQNLIEETNEKRIKDFVLESLLDRPDLGYLPYDFMALNEKYFTPNFLSFLESSNVILKEDTKDDAYIYYKNCVVKVTQDSITEIDYIDVDGYVWKRQIIDRDFVKSDHHAAIFRTFLWLISGKNVEKYNSFKSVIGYLLHSYKTSANNKAIIFNDETISENPNGGSGKGLFWNALSHMKKVTSIDGKTFEFTKSFPYQTVSTDTQILVFDDVKKNFSFESLFSLITEGITLEYKGQDAIKVPVSKSPKILITTNYTIGGIGGSFERRKFEVEMSDYFSYKHTPVDEFGHMLFDDWDNDEWYRFDNFMINCAQYYLKNGLVKHDFHNLEVRKFIKETSFEFYEWSKEDDNLKFGVRLNKGQYFDAFLSEYPDFKVFKLSQKRFKMWLEQFCKYYGFTYKDGNSNGERWFEILKSNQTSEPESDIPF